MISLLKQAISYQTRYKLDAMNGEASDRHMFGLYVASKMAGLQPKLFKQKVGKERVDYLQINWNLPVEAV